VAHLDGIALLRERVGAERGLLKIRAVDRRAVLRKERGAVGARTLHLERAAIEAIVMPLLPAIGAAAAPWIGHDDVIAGREIAHRAADGMNDTGAFVPINR